MQKTSIVAFLMTTLAWSSVHGCSGCKPGDGGTTTETPTDSTRSPDGAESTPGDATRDAATPPKTGGLAVTVSVPGEVDNCSTATGITADVVTLTKQVMLGSSCATVTFVRIGPDGSLLDDYPVNCSSPIVATCVQRGEVWTVPIMSPGDYTIHVVGKSLASDCWRNDDAIQVTAGETSMRVLSMRHVDGTPGCEVPPR